MRVSNPKILIPPALYGLDYTIERLRSNLTALPWLEYAFHRAYSFKRVPMVYIGNKEYFTVLPNDFAKSFCFFIGRGPDSIPDNAPQLGWTAVFEKSVDLIFYLNLDRIDSAKDYIYTEQLKLEVLRIIQRTPGCKALNIYNETLEDVYSGFTLKEVNDNLLKKPYAGLRFNLQLRYENKCQ